MNSFYLPPCVSRHSSLNAASLSEYGWRKIPNLRGIAYAESFLTALARFFGQSAESAGGQSKCTKANRWRLKSTCRHAVPVFSDPRRRFSQYAETGQVLDVCWQFAKTRESRRKCYRIQPAPAGMIAVSVAGSVQRRRQASRRPIRHSSLQCRSISSVPAAKSGFRSAKNLLENKARVLNVRR